MSGSNPPSTSGSPCVARRALKTSAVALMGVALPVVLVAATSAFAADGGAPTTAVANAPVGDHAPVEARAASAAVPFRDAAPATPAALAAPPATPPSTVAPPPPPAPAVAPTPPPVRRAVGDPNDPAAWDRLARCESGGNWTTNTGNGYYGGLQFSLSSWQAVGGTGYPHEASRDAQIEMGKRLYASGGWKHWPACTRSFGWR